MSKLICAFVRKPASNTDILFNLHKSKLCLSTLTENRITGKYLFQIRNYNSKKKEDSSSLTNVKSTEVGEPILTKVKETTKTVSYLGVIVAGVGVTAFIFYQIFKELFSSKSPNSVYSASLVKCCADPRVADTLGEPIKGFGEETRRGRRRHVSHLYYEKDGVLHLRMKYYIQGIRKRATVHLETFENEKGNFDYRYLFVQLDDFPRDIIVIEDNRLDQKSVFSDHLESI
ncbi:hypothetical protein L9F63_021429 [Diploptera punctata]|uniref:Mitochondrial import inner membrane translocase subunit Tim21 n=1 Tax=Diploptera punctata TaxID=6984 RepID=A0AAD7ZNX6_DIPPU|nr:hypothetical protein L9F63_021429 [Diploptera punctata]